MYASLFLLTQHASDMSNVIYWLLSVLSKGWHSFPGKTYENPSVTILIGLFYLVSTTCHTSSSLKSSHWSLSFTIHDTEQGNFTAKFEMLDSILNIIFNTIWGSFQGLYITGQIWSLVGCNTRILKNNFLKGLENAWFQLTN